MTNILRSFFCLIAVISLLPSGSLAKTAKRTKTVSVAARKLQDNLQKIDASIDVTKQKLKSQSETQFAPDLYFMLAELLHDKASASAALKAEQNPGAPAGEVDYTQEKRISQDAIETYKLIEDRFPKYGAMDRVLYTVAMEYKGLQLEKEAMEYFKKVSGNFPDSAYAAKSLIEIGDIFFNRKDYEFALEQYKKAQAKAKEPELSTAYFKGGWCLTHSEKWLESVQSFEKVFTVSDSQVVKADGKDDLREEALVASVWPLLELAPHQMQGQILYQKPIEYYRKMSGDKSRFRRVLARLAQRLDFKKRSRESIEASFELFHISDDMKEKRSAFESAYMGMKKLKSDSFPLWLPQALRDLLLEMRRDTQDRKNRKDVVKYEPVFRDIVTSLNKSALVTKRPDDLKAVAEAYDDYFVIYSRGRKIPQMKLNQAEVLFGAKQYGEAGQAYLDLTRRLSARSQKRRQGFLDSALESFLKGISESESPLEKFQARDGYRDAAKNYQRYYPRDSKLAGIRFNAAKTYYDEQKFDVAAKELQNFLKVYPGSPQSREAALLYLDCYYLRDQMKEMTEAGKRVLAMRGLSPDARSAVQKASSQAAMKAIRSVAGDFSSKEYATKFREFAKKNKNSAMGENALYEAFVSLKAQNQPQAFDVGEEYIGSYEKSPRAKEVLLSLIQQSLVLLDYSRAASYMGSFAQRYSEDPQARNLALQAAQIYDNLGNVSQASAAYRLAGNSSMTLKVFSKYQDWSNLEKASANVSGLQGQYFQGLAMLRQGRKAAGLQLLQRVIGSSGSSPEEKEMVAHAAVILAEDALAKFHDLGKGQAFSAALLQSKAGQYQAISNDLQTAVGTGGGRWVIGALYNLGRLNKDFADFLRTAKPPAGMNSAQLQQLVQPQVKGYEASASQNYGLCLKLAEDNEIPTSYVGACRSRGILSEVAEVTPWKKMSSRMPAAVSSKYISEVVKNPRSVDLLRKMAADEMRAGNPQKALLILSRASEIDPQDALNDSYAGIAYLHLKQYSEAQVAFQQAIGKNPKDILANRGMAGIAKFFGYQKKAQEYRAKSSGSAPGIELHPWLK